MQITSGDVFVRKAGDTMTGALTISANVTNAIIVNRPDGAVIVPLTAQLAGVNKWQLQLGTSDPFFQILNSSGAYSMRIFDASHNMDTVIAPLATIGDTGSVTSNGVAAGAFSFTTIAPAGFTSRTAVFFSVRNSVAAVNNGMGYCGPVNQTDLRAEMVSFNSDSTTSFGTNPNAAGQSLAGGKNTNAGVANLTMEWASVGR